MIEGLEQQDAERLALAGMVGVMRQEAAELPDESSVRVLLARAAAACEERMGDELGEPEPRAPRPADALSLVERERAALQRIAQAGNALAALLGVTPVGMLLERAASACLVRLPEEEPA